MKKEMKIKKLNKDDLDIYAKILQEELGYTNKEAISYLNKKNIKNMLKIELGGVAIGFINYTRRGDIFYINDIDISKGWRSKGYGSYLLSYLERKAKRIGIKEIRLHVNIKNKQTINFYLKNGYKKWKIIKNFYRNKFDAYLFIKKIR